LWTAAVHPETAGRAVHYPCRPENAFVPDPQEVAQLVGRPGTRAMVIINTNKPHRSGSIRAAGFWKRSRSWPSGRGLIVFSDEIYDQMTYDGAEFVPMATLVRDTLCAHTLGPVQGLSCLRLTAWLGWCVLRTHPLRAV